MTNYPGDRDDLDAIVPVDDDAGPVDDEPGPDDPEGHHDDDDPYDDDDGPPIDRAWEADYRAHSSSHTGLYEST